jgi:hypothetical protein
MRCHVHETAISAELSLCSEFALDGEDSALLVFENCNPFSLGEDND